MQQQNLHILHKGSKLSTIFQMHRWGSEESWHKTLWHKSKESIPRHGGTSVWHISRGGDTSVESDSSMQGVTSMQGGTSEDWHQWGWHISEGGTSVQGSSVEGWYISVGSATSMLAHQCRVAHQWGHIRGGGTSVGDGLSLESGSLGWFSLFFTFVQVNPICPIDGTKPFSGQHVIQTGIFQSHTSQKISKAVSISKMYKHLQKQSTKMFLLLEAKANSTWNAPVLPFKKVTRKFPNSEEIHQIFFFRKSERQLTV